MIGALGSWFDPSPVWQATGEILGATIAVPVQIVGERLIRQAVRRTQSSFDDILFGMFRLAVVVTVFLADVYPAGQAKCLGA